VRLSILGHVEDRERVFAAVQQVRRAARHQRLPDAGWTNEVGHYAREVRIAADDAGNSRLAAVQRIAHRQNGLVLPADPAASAAPGHQASGRTAQRLGRHRAPVIVGRAHPGVADEGVEAAGGDARPVRQLHELTDLHHPEAFGHLCQLFGGRRGFSIGRLDVERRVLAAQERQALVTGRARNVDDLDARIVLVQAQRDQPIFVDEHDQIARPRLRPQPAQADRSPPFRVGVDLVVREERLAVLDDDRHALPLAQHAGQLAQVGVGRGVRGRRRERRPVAAGSPRGRGGSSGRG
jgi:hypothetical protein